MHHSCEPRASGGSRLTLARFVRAQNASGRSEQGFQIRRIDRLHQVTVEASFRRLSAILPLAIPGHGDQEETVLAKLLAQMLGHLVPVHVGEPYVQENG